MPPRFRRDYLIQRAGNRCEYCHFPQERLSLGLYVDHIIARQHGGGDEETNLAMSYEHCNACKGPNLASVDQDTGEKIWLFDPRRDEWSKNFQIVDDEVRGITPMGRATASLLDMNNANNILFRRILRLLGIPVGA
jgi:hypothetical protein